MAGTIATAVPGIMQGSTDDVERTKSSILRDLIVGIGKTHLKKTFGIRHQSTRIYNFVPAFPRVTSNCYVLVLRREEQVLRFALQQLSNFQDGRRHGTESKRVAV